MPHRSPVAWSALLLAHPAAGCSSLTQGDCVSVGVPGVQVTVVDARTGQAPGGATLTLTDGAYREVVGGASVPGPPGVLYGALERPGTYAATVTAPGYLAWTQANVVVTRGGRCNYLRRVELTARLERASTSGQ